MAAVFSNNPPARAGWLEWLPIAVGLLVLFVPTFYDLAHGIWQEDEFAHGPLILAVILWLIWDKRRILLTPPERPQPLPGTALVLSGLLIYVIGRILDISILEIASILPVLAGLLVAMRGTSALRGYWFMLLFIVYLVPLPGIFIDAITGPLKQHISSIAEQILYAAGYPIARSGVVLTVGQYQLLVADACSGINSMFSLSAIGLLYLYLMQRKSWIHNGIILASLLPIAFCANIIRVMFLVLVTYHFGDSAGQGFLHGFSGMVLFFFALISVLTLDAILLRIIKPFRPA